MRAQARDARPSVDEVVAGLSTWSDKIRALDRAGYTRAEIARLLNKRYQHVRNVLEAEKQRSGPAPSADGSGPADPNVQDLKVGPNGRITLPAGFRVAAGIKDGDVIEACLEGDEIRLIGFTAAVRLARELVAKYVPPDVDLVADLFEERRREVAREEEEIRRLAAAKSRRR